MSRRDGETDARGGGRRTDTMLRFYQGIKTKYDPGNFFHMNQNIRPLV
jgi:hypothetical protein